MKKLGVCLFIVISVILSGCVGVTMDKFEGFWVSENLLTYDYSKYRYGVIKLDQMPYDIFTERWLVFFKIDKKDNKYAIKELSHHFEAINESAGNYVEQINNLKKFDENKLDQGQYDPDAVVEGDTITLNGKHTVHLMRDVKKGNKTERIGVDVREIYKLCYESNSLVVKEHYYETSNGERIDIPANDMHNISKRFKRMTISEFKNLYNDIQNKALEMATGTR